MTVRLYLETNFLMSHANGRDPASSRLIDGSMPGLQVALPTCCVMEALTNLAGEQKRINGLIGQSRALVNEFERNPASLHAVRLAALHSEAESHWRDGLQFFMDRLREVIRWVADPTRVSCLATDPASLVALRLEPAALDPTDQLILATILGDAVRHPSTTKVLVTENRRCFHDNQEIRRILAAAGIRYLSSVTIFLQWYEARAES